MSDILVRWLVPSGPAQTVALGTPGATWPQQLYAAGLIPEPTIAAAETYMAGDVAATQAAAASAQIQAEEAAGSATSAANNAIAAQAQAQTATAQATSATGAASTATDAATTAMDAANVATAQAATATTQSSSSASSASIATAQAVGATSAAATATAAASLATTEASAAQNFANIAAAAVLGLPYFPYPLNAGSAAAGTNILPQGIISGTVGGAAITGATIGTYPLTPTGGSFTGVVANLVVTSSTAANIQIVYPGRTSSATPTAPTWANPAGATLPSGTTLTPNVGPQIANGSGQYYLTSDSSGSYLLYWQNTGTGAPVAVTSATGDQLKYPLATAISSLMAILLSAGPRFWNGAAIRSIIDMDSNGRMSVFVDANGVLYAQLGAESPDGSIAIGYNPATGRTTFSSPVVPGIKALGGGATIDTTPRKLYYGGRAVVLSERDAAGQGGYQLLSDNSFRFGQAEFENGIGLDVGLETPNYVFTTRIVNGRRQLFRHSKETGIKTQITTLGNNAHPRLSLDGTAVVYATDRWTRAPEAVKWTTMYQPLDGGSEHPMVSLPDLVCPGDSLTFGYGANMPYTGTLSALLASAGIGVLNAGWGGQTTAQMARRIGALTAIVTVSGNQITAGANSITQLGGAALGNATTLGTIADDHRLLTHARSDAVTAYGTLAGIYGTMFRTVDGSNNEVYTFTPDAAVMQTLPAACPANSTWQSVNDWRDRTVIFYGGYNDRAFPANVIANIDAIVSYLAPKVKKFLIFTVASGGSENLSSTGSGLTNYQNIVNVINPHIRATYPNNFFDNWKYLVGAITVAGQTTTQALSDCGMTPTAGDLTDIANQCVPRSLRASAGADNIHMIDQGYRAVAQFGVYPALVARGWHVR